jgi:hypothetical protein
MWRFQEISIIPESISYLMQQATDGSEKKGQKQSTVRKNESIELIIVTKLFAVVISYYIVLEQPKNDIYPPTN